jgi:hypothetical protein
MNAATLPISETNLVEKLPVPVLPMFIFISTSQFFLPEPIFIRKPYHHCRKLQLFAKLKTWFFRQGLLGRSGGSSRAITPNAPTQTQRTNDILQK